ncbi:MAG: hypothetical protein AAFP76_07105 [Bacteroidota bacterium]
MENWYFVIAIVFAVLVIFVFQTVEKIKRARAVGKKLHKKNGYYAFVAKFFVKDLPD